MKVNEVLFSLGALSSMVAAQGTRPPIILPIITNTPTTLRTSTTSRTSTSTGLATTTSGAAVTSTTSSRTSTSTGSSTSTGTVTVTTSSSTTGASTTLTTSATTTTSGLLGTTTTTATGTTTTAAGTTTTTAGTTTTTAGTTTTTAGTTTTTAGTTTSAAPPSPSLIRITTSTGDNTLVDQRAVVNQLTGAVTFEGTGGSVVGIVTQPGQSDQTVQALDTIGPNGPAYAFASIAVTFAGSALPGVAGIHVFPIAFGPSAIIGLNELVDLGTRYVSPTVTPASGGVLTAVLTFDNAPIAPLTLTQTLVCGGQLAIGDGVLPGCIPVTLRYNVA